MKKRIIIATLILSFVLSAIVIATANDVVALVSAFSNDNLGNTVRISFSEPVLLPIDNAKQSIYAADSTFPTPGENGSWQIGLLQNDTACLAVNPDADGYAAIYELTFAEAIPKSGVIRIVENATEPDTNNTISFISSKSGAFLTCSDPQTDSFDVTYIEYGLPMQVSSLYADTDKSITICFDDEIVINENPDLNLISIINGDTELHPIEIILTSTNSCRFIFEESLPTTGTFCITEQPNDTNSVIEMWLTTAAGSGIIASESDRDIYLSSYKKTAYIYSAIKTSDNTISVLFNMPMNGNTNFHINMYACDTPFPNPGVNGSWQYAPAYGEWKNGNMQLDLVFNDVVLPDEGVVRLVENGINDEDSYIMSEVNHAANNIPIDANSGGNPGFDVASVEYTSNIECINMEILPNEQRTVILEFNMPICITDPYYINSVIMSSDNTEKLWQSSLIEIDAIEYAGIVINSEDTHYATEVICRFDKAYSLLYNKRPRPQNIEFDSEDNLIIQIADYNDKNSDGYISSNIIRGINGMRLKSNQTVNTIYDVLKIS